MTWPLLAIGLLLISPQVMADGKALHEQSCLQCHATLMADKASMIYTRSDRKVMRFQQLESRVESCGMAAGVHWQPEEYQQVIQYLATTFYQFN
jgi:mono/diheme cytochrome c family protein